MRRSIRFLLLEVSCIEMTFNQYNSYGRPLEIARVGDLKVTDPKDKKKKKAYSLRL